MSMKESPPHSLRAAITAALVIKALLLAWLWQAFFSQPQAPHMRMAPDAVAQHLITPSPEKEHHDAPR